MKWQVPRKRVILSWHRWVGVCATLFLVILALTGLALNHTERLKLDQVYVKNGFILSQYGMSGGSDITTYRIHGTNTLSHLDGSLFYNGTLLGPGGFPLGIIEGGPMTVVATATKLLYLSEMGELIEQVDTYQLPWEELQILGEVVEADALVFVTDTGLWQPDADWIEFKRYEGAYVVDAMLEEVALREEEQAAILEAFQGQGIPLYRVILDLHSGKLFGWGGRTVMDLTALAILLLIASGISGWLRKARYQMSPRTKR